MITTSRSIATTILTAALVPALLAGAATAGTVLHVDASAPAGGDGLAWATAYDDLQSALADANAPGSGVSEIWVVAGTYPPAPAGGDRTATFALRSGLALYGGFAGAETSRDERDPVANETTLSGDLDGDDAAGVEPLDNSLHVVTLSGTDATCVLDGFTVRAGVGDDGSGAGPGGVGGAGGALFIEDGSPSIVGCVLRDSTARLGCGAYVFDGSPVFTRCTITGNLSARSGEGAGIYAAVTSGGSAALTLVDCTVSFNAAYQGHFATGHGAGIYAGPGVDLDVSGTTFESNYTFHNQSYGHATTGGACSIQGGAATFTRCTFVQNYSSLGAGIYATGPLTIVNCLFTGNRAVGVGCAGPECNNAPDVYSGYGGGVYATGAASVIACTFAGNWAAKTSAGAVLAAGTIQDSVVWGNETYPVCCGEDPLPLVRSQLTGNFDASFSCIEGLFTPEPGEDPVNPADFPGSLEDDPLFTTSPVLSSLGHLVTPGDLRLQPGSPCTDAGDNTAIPAGLLTDLDGNDRFHDDPAAPDTGVGSGPIVDMGVYEHGAGTLVPGDADGNGLVDVNDLLAVLGAWGACGGCPADVTGDGVVDVSDLLEVLAHWS